MVHIKKLKKKKKKNQQTFEVVGEEMSKSREQ